MTPITLAPFARRSIIEAITAHPGRECLFRAHYDPDERRIETAFCVRVGSAAVVHWHRQDFQPGQLALHNHPGPLEPWDLWPSQGDLDAARDLAYWGVGLALVNDAASHVFLVRPPAGPELARAIAALAPPLPVAAVAPAAVPSAPPASARPELVPAIAWPEMALGPLGPLAGGPVLVDPATGACSSYTAAADQDVFDPNPRAAAARRAERAHRGRLRQAGPIPRVYA